MKDREIDRRARREGEQRRQQTGRAEIAVEECCRGEDGRRERRRARKADPAPLGPLDLRGQVEQPRRQPRNLRHIKDLRPDAHDDQIQHVVGRAHGKAGVGERQDQQTAALVPQREKTGGAARAEQHRNLKQIVEQFKISLFRRPSLCLLL